MMQELDELICNRTEKTGKRLGSLKHAGTRTFGRLVWVADEAVSVTSLLPCTVLLTKIC